MDEIYLQNPLLFAICHMSHLFPPLTTMASGCGVWFFTILSTLGGPECRLIGEAEPIPAWKDSLFLADPAEPPFSHVSMPLVTAEPWRRDLALADSVGTM
uniref:Uncharacterized protein n=1 Tax=Arundo donax TaxID=35708 RepID=A0A0A9EQ78_ARUDO